MRLIVMLAAAVFAALASLAGGAYAAEISGGLSGSIYNRDDDVSTQDYSITRMRLRLNASEFAGDNVFAKFSGSFRSAGSNDYNDEIPDSRIDEAKVEVRKAWDLFDMELGRHFIRDLPAARVDGGSLRMYVGENLGVGVFGGQAPDPYTDKVSGDYMSYGGYIFSNTPSSGLSLGYVYDSYKGAEDASYIYGSMFMAPSKTLRIFGIIRTDHNVADSTYEITNLMVTASYRPSRSARLSVSYNQYRAIRLYESMDYSLNYDMQQSVRVTGEFKLTRTTTLYGNFDARTRETDNKSATLFTVGAKQEDMFRWFFMDVSYSQVDYFTSSVMRAKGSIGADLGESLVAELSVAYMKNDQDDAANSLTQLIYAGSLEWYFTPQIYVSGRVEMSDESYLDIDSVYLEKNKDTFSALTYFLYVGYNF